MKDLSYNELVETNGGSTGFGITLQSSAESLLNVTFESQSASGYQKTVISVGNNISLDLNALAGKSV